MSGFGWGLFFVFSLFTSLGIFSFFSSNSRVYEAEIKSKELSTCCSLGPKVSDLLSSLHLLESSCGCYPYMLVYILLSIYMLYVYIYLHTHHTVSKVFIVLMGRIGKSPFTSCLQEKTVSALAFKSAGQNSSVWSFKVRLQNLHSFSYRNFADCHWTMSTHKTRHLFSSIDLECRKGLPLSLWEYKGNKTDTGIGDLPVYLGQKDHHVPSNQKEMLHCTAVHKEGINVISEYDQIIN